MQLHVVAWCIYYLECFSWGHNSILNFLTQNLQSVIDFKIFADVPGFNSPSIIFGNAYPPDLLLESSLVILCYMLYVIHICYTCRTLSLLVESNLHKNVRRKQEKYENLINQLRKNFNDVKCVNISMSFLGVFANESVARCTVLWENDKYCNQNIFRCRNKE